jgi:hypothetical protein
MTKSIVILGDSTSMSIGAERAMYPFKLAEKCAWAKNTKMINCSLPGFTSADACQFFFKHKTSFGKLTAVIIYLGNCDTMASELPRYRSTAVQSVKMQLKKILKTGPNRIRIKNRFLYFEWNKEFDQSIETAVTAVNFEYNVARVVRYCTNKNVTVILIRPEAHVMFPAGSGKGNYVFYHYLGLNPTLSQRMVFEDQRFITAAKAYERKNFQKAGDIYKDILLYPDEISRGLEYQTLLVNNFAACQANLNELDEAEYLLNMLLKERDVRREIINYNLSIISKIRGDHEGFSDRLFKTYEIDNSMYRVRNPYKQATDRIAKRYPDVKIVDMRTLVTDEDFVDHCHPLPDAQNKLADAIFEHLKNSALLGSKPLKIENHLYNPEYSLGIDLDFYQYFNAYSDLNSDQLNTELRLLEGKLASPHNRLGWPQDLISKLPKDMAVAIKYYQRHPMFPSLYDVIKAKPINALDVGRFPEFFLCRYLVPFLSYLENHPELISLFPSDLSILRSADDLLNILPPGIKTNSNREIPFLDKAYMSAWRQRILDAVSQAMTLHLQEQNQIEERLKTTIYWYFRETLRFGSHSRISMRYERIQLEYIAEGLAVALVLGKLTGVSSEDVKPMLKLLEGTVKIHEKFCAKYNPKQDPANLLLQYDKELAQLQTKIIL